MDRVKKAILYCRVSTTRQQEEGTSLESQAEACIGKAKELGFEILRVTKEAYTGADLFERPLLNIDRADIRAGKVDAIIIYAIDRLSRNIAHLAIIDEECRKAKCELIFVQEDIDSSPEGKLLLSVRGYVAEVERLKIRERSMRGRRSKILNGIAVITGRVLYGYTTDSDKRHFVINEAEAVIVRRIFELAEKGYGAYLITRKLNEEKRAAPRGNFWALSTVNNILNNEAYAGVEYAYKFKNENGKITKRPRSEWVKMPSDTRPAIIQLSQWERVNQERPVIKGAVGRNEKSPILLRGLVWCDLCNARMQVTPWKKKNTNITYIRFRCKRRSLGDVRICSNSNPFESKLNREVMGWLKEFLNSPQALNSYRESLRAKTEDQSLDREIEVTSKLLEKTSRGLQRLLTSFRNADDILAQAIEREIYAARNEKDALERTLVVLHDRQTRNEATTFNFEAFEASLRILREELDTLTVEKTNALLSSLNFKVFINRRDYKIKLSL